MCRLQTDPTNPLEAVESYQEGANLLSQARWIARPSPVAARTFRLHSTRAAHAGRLPGRSRLSHPLLVAGDGDGGAGRPKDREDAEHARHGAALGFRSPNWRLRLPAAMATSLASVASLASLAMAAAAFAVPRCLAGPAVERTTFLHTRRSKSACDSSCTRSWASRSTTRRTRRPRRPRRHGLTSKRGPMPREARSQERPDHKRRPTTTERLGAKGPGAKGPGAERPGAEGPGGCTAGRPAGEAWTVVQRRPRRLVSQ